VPNGIIVDGQLGWSRGVDSSRVKTIASQAYPDGLPRDALAWLINGTVRGGGITQRTGWQPVVQGAKWRPGNELFQGAFFHQPDYADPQLLVAIGGKLWRVRLDTDNSVEDLSTLLGFTMPAGEPQSYFAQAEQFTVWQCGDETTNPLFYWTSLDGNTPFMRRSLGFVAVNDPTNEIPAAGPMDYSQQRLWYAFGRNYAAGDIVLNKTSGTAPFDYRDSVLHVTENPVAKGGDAFIVPTNAGNIRALKHAPNLDTALGETNLFVFTRRAVYSCLAPITRDDWTKATLDLMPLQRVALQKGGTYAERSVVAVNDDLYFQSPPNGDIRSLQTSIRYFHQPGNLPLSKEENRILVLNDRSLLRFGSGIEFDNRLYQTSSPINTPAGVAYQTLLPLDFDLISTLSDRKAPAWEGQHQGLPVLQMVEADFGGRGRAFAIVWSDKEHEIQIWEITNDQRFENGDKRVQWAIEFPAYSWGDPLKPKKLTGGSLWVDKMLGTVIFRLQYRPDSYPCWIDWHTWQQCAARDCLEDPFEIRCDYPVQQFCEGYEPDMDFPVPPVTCVNTKTKRPSNIGYQFQARLLIKGWTRVRGLLLYAQPWDKSQYGNIVC
jgi:hypothetical protein